MKTLLIILIAPIAAAFVYAFVYAAYLIISGKEKSAEIQALIADKKRRKAEKKARRQSAGTSGSLPEQIRSALGQPF